LRLKNAIKLCLTHELKYLEKQMKPQFFSFLDFWKVMKPHSYLLTNADHLESPCGCVLPMQVGLRLSVALYTFFSLVSIRTGKTKQVRIIRANAASQQPEKTVVPY